MIASLQYFVFVVVVVVENYATEPQRLPHNHVYAYMFMLTWTDGQIWSVAPMLLHCCCDHIQACMLGWSLRLLY